MRVCEPGAVLLKISRRKIVAVSAGCVVLSNPRMASMARGQSILGASDLAVVIEAEFSHPTSTSAQAIELGVAVALDEINAARPPGKPRLILRRSDNGGVSAIARDNFLDAARDPTVVGVFGGKFSPVQIELVPLAQELGLMLLNPWGSADAITDHGAMPNWVYRLSLKDAWAAPAFLDFARTRHGATEIGVLAPTTAWGRSNDLALAAAAGPTGTRIIGTRWYSWGERSLVRRYQELREVGAKAIILVANEIEASILVHEVAALPAEQRLPIISHWGITGGQFARLAGPALRAVDLSVIQTFTFHGNMRPRAIALRAACLRRLPPEAGGRIESPVGVAHAYDLTHLLALAIDRASATTRPAIREEMDRLPAFAGAVRDYDPAFTPTRHDALSPEQLFFARYTDDGDLVPVS